MRAFFDTYYTPDNMFLLVAGDVESKSVFDLAQRYFGDWKPYRGKRPRLPVVPPAKAGPTRVHGTGSGAAELTVAYRMPPAGSVIDVEGDMIAMLLGDEDGPLTEKLVRESKVATEVRVNLENRLYGSTLWITVTMKEGHAPEEAESVVLAQVQQVVDQAPSAKMMATLKRRYRARILGVVKSDMMIGFTFLRYEAAGSWKNIDRNLAHARTVDGEALRSLAERTLVPVNRVVGIYETGTRPVTAPTPRRHEPTAKRKRAPAGDRRPESWTDLEFRKKPVVAPSGEKNVITFSNGITVVAVPDPDDQVFKIEALIRGGSADDPEGREGTAEILAGGLSLSGLRGVSREKIREKLESMVAGYNVTAERFALRFSLDTFPQDRAAALSLFHDLVGNSVLEATTTDTEREKLKARLTAADTRPGRLSRRALRRLQWGKDARTRRATRESVDAIEFADLERAMVAHRDPRRVILLVSGAFDREEIVGQLERTFGQWRPQSGTVPTIPTSLSARPNTGLHVMDFDSSQGYVLIGARAVSRADVRYPALVMLQAVLSRRIFNRIRSNEGLAYQAAAQIIPDWEVPSLCAVVFQTKNQSVPYGISLALEELAKLAREGPGAEEMENARKAHGAKLTRALGRSSGRAAAFGELVLQPLVGLDWYQRVRSAVLKTTPADIQFLASQLFKRGRLSIVCVGNQAKMQAGDGEHPVQLSDFGPIQTIAPPSRNAGPETAESVALKLIRSISRADVEGITSLLADTMKKRLSTDAAREQLMMQAQFFANSTYEVTETTEDGDESTVTVTFAVKRGEQTMKVPLLFQLRKIEGHWLCTDFRPKGR